MPIQAVAGRLAAKKAAKKAARKSNAKKKALGALEGKAQATTEQWPDALSPAGFLFIFWAILLDIFGLITLGIGSVFVAVLGMLTIGLYEWKKMGKMPLMGKASTFLMGKGKVAKWFEVIPLAGAFPIWTYYVTKKIIQSRK